MEYEEPSADKLTAMMLLHSVAGLNDAHGGPNEVGRVVYSRMLAAIRGERERIAKALADLGLPDVAASACKEPTVTVSCLACGDTGEVRSNVAAAAGVEVNIPCSHCAERRKERNGTSAPRTV
jgi:hypothetical protein